MTKSNFQTALLLLLFCFYSCNKEIKSNGKLVEKNIEIKDFSTLNLDGNFRTVFIKDTKNLVEIESFENIVENLNIKEEDKALTISENKKVLDAEIYNITIHYKDFSILELLHNTMVDNPSILRNKTLEITAKDKSKLISTIYSDNLTLKMQDSAKVNLNGKAKSVRLIMKNKAELIANYLSVGSLDFDMKDTSYTEIIVREKLKGNASDKAQIIYVGNPITEIKETSKNIINKK